MTVRAPAVTMRMQDLWECMSEPTSTDLDRLAAAETLIGYVRAWEASMVRRLRDRGRSWDEIAGALGLTRATVLYRYRDVGR